ncbi:MarR family transcriptional regulator [Stutzerimonas stutzeri]|uniref:MarR family transcriptional regulator n=1 Tax=Stutzerimonas stutzeri TaxID=316 RepID=W8RW29_STUST|nr:MarR family transcriptional regulator [Stutzerimonas stutzeri]AHL76311.1 MarR family transcriptional regulator [Stutzerimonas stutzeri]MCQ4329543.1 MarR family transcriptional regulator [Stutzerimonas stutzeri]
MPHFDRNNYSVENSLGHLIALINQLKDRILERKLADHDLTAAQFKVVLLMGHRSASTPAELSRILSIDSGAMTRMLDRLEGKDLLRRERCDNDRRQVQLVLTERGTTLSEQIPAIAADAMNELTECLSGAEVSEFERVLKKMLVAVDALPHPRGDA